MKIDRLILVETSSPGNLGAALRIAANFDVATVALVRPKVEVDHPDVARWACGAAEIVAVEAFDRLEAAAADCRTLMATASVRGRPDQPVIGPGQALEAAARRGPGDTALVFGSETRGLSKEDLDRCDLAVRIPTNPRFPVLNLVQAIAILLSHFAIDDATSDGEPPAEHRAVDALMEHLRTTLLDIGYLDPVNPDRVLRKMRRVFGRAGLTENEVAIFRGICRQVEWARTHPEQCGDTDRGRFNQEATDDEA